MYVIFYYVLYYIFDSWLLFVTVLIITIANLCSLFIGYEYYLLQFIASLVLLCISLRALFSLYRVLCIAVFLWLFLFYHLMCFLSCLNALGKSCYTDDVSLYIEISPLFELIFLISYSIFVLFVF